MSFFGHFSFYDTRQNINIIDAGAFLRHHNQPLAKLQKQPPPIPKIETIYKPATPYAEPSHARGCLRGGDVQVERLSSEYYPVEQMTDCRANLDRTGVPSRLDGKNQTRPPQWR